MSDIGLDPEVLQILALGGPDAGAGRADGGAVGQREGARADDGAHGGHAQNAAQLEILEALREHLRVRGGALVLHDDHGAVEGLQRAGQILARVAAAGVLVALPHQNAQEFLVDAAAAVESLVDDQVPSSCGSWPDPG